MPSYSFNDFWNLELVFTISGGGTVVVPTGLKKNLSKFTVGDALDIGKLYKFTITGSVGQKQLVVDVISGNGNGLDFIPWMNSTSSRPSLTFFDSLFGNPNLQGIIGVDDFRLGQYTKLRCAKVNGDPGVLVRVRANTPSSDPILSSLIVEVYFPGSILDNTIANDSNGLTDWIDGTYQGYVGKASGLY